MLETWLDNIFIETRKVQANVSRFQKGKYETKGTIGVGNQTTKARTNKVVMKNAKPCEIIKHQMPQNERGRK